MVKEKALVLDMTFTWKEDVKVRGMTGTRVLILQRRKRKGDIQDYYGRTRRCSRRQGTAAFPAFNVSAAPPLLSWSVSHQLLPMAAVDLVVGFVAGLWLGLWLRRRRHVPVLTPDGAVVECARAVGITVAKGKVVLPAGSPPVLLRPGEVVNQVVLSDEKDLAIVRVGTKEEWTGERCCPFTPTEDLLISPRRGLLVRLRLPTGEGSYGREQVGHILGISNQSARVEITKAVADANGGWLLFHEVRTVDLKDLPAYYG